MFRFFEALIDPFRDHDDSMPPANLIAYYGRYCRQIRPLLFALMAVGLIVSLIEVTILRFVGALVDTLRTSRPDEVFQTHGREFLGMALLILIGRPLASFTHDLIVQQAIAPGMTNLIAGRPIDISCDSRSPISPTTSPGASPRTSCSRPPRSGNRWCRSSMRSGS